MDYKDIYAFIKQEESAYGKPIQLEDGWNWSMKEHLRRSFLYKHSQFEEHNDDRDLRPFKNIVRPILNIQYRTEGFDVKDIELYVDDPEIYFKSFLVKKFHETWALENSLDTFIDELVESYVDYGGTLVRIGKEARPEVVDLRSLAFCDQVNLLASPFGIKHVLTPQELREMEEWGKPANGATISTEALIALTKDKKNIDIYEIHGFLPRQWLDGKEGSVMQIQVCGFYKNQEKEDVGVTLFKHKQPKLPFKFLSRDKVFGRGLGFGGVEELFDSQVWTNYSEVQIAEMLQHASKVLYKTTDPSFRAKNNLNDVSTGEVMTVMEGRDINQLDTSPRNLVVFTNALEQWERHAQQIGAAGEALLGESPSSGTPFKLQELVTMEAKGLHKYRQGKIAVFVDEIYREDILPHIAREIVKGKTFLSELSFDELQSVSDSVISKAEFDFQKEKILNGEEILPEETERAKIQAGKQFSKGGNRKMIQILKDEFKNTPLKVRTNIAGKQKNLALLTDKIVNLLRQFISTPQIRQDPEMIKLLNVILESSGMSPMMFGASMTALPPQAGGTEPLKALGESVREPVMA